MKTKTFLISILFSLSFFGCNAGTPPSGSSDGSIVYLSDQTFKQKVFNYETQTEWKFAGNKPCLIDFYADWCSPCRMLSPILVELAKEYKDQIVVYKINTDKERILSQNLGIQSLPTLLFCPLDGKPQASMGYRSKEDLKKLIDEVLLKNK